MTLVQPYPKQNGYMTEDPGDWETRSTPLKAKSLQNGIVIASG